MSNLFDAQYFDIYVLCRDTRTGAVIVRCSQPEVGWLGWRSTQDEVLLSAITAACKLNPGSASTVSNGKTGDIFISLGFLILLYMYTLNRKLHKMIRYNIVLLELLVFPYSLYHVK